MRILLLLIVWAMLLWPRTGAEAFTGYTATWLGGARAHFYGPFFSPGAGLNNAGQVAGKAVVPVGEIKRSHAVLWDPVAGLRDLTPGMSQRSVASDVNDVGQVVVNVEQYLTSFGDYRAFLWEDGVMTELGTLGEARMSYAIRVNEVGQVIGYTYGPGGSPFVWDRRSGMREIGSLGGGETRVDDINDLGQLVGSSTDTQGHPRPFLWQAGVMTDISGGSWIGVALAINNLGQAVGVYYDPAAQVGGGFVWDAQSGLRNLGSLGGKYTYPVAINNLGQIVGWEDMGYQREAAFIWEDGVMMNLNDLVEPGEVPYVSRALAINDRGQILCSAGESLVLLTPIPEPASLAGLCLALGGLGVGWMRRRRCRASSRSRRSRNGGIWTTRHGFKVSTLI